MMLTLLELLPTLLCALLFAAHWLRSRNHVLALVSLALPLLLLVPRRWAALSLQVFLIIAAAEWTRTALHIAAVRIQHDQDWKRATLILLGVAAVNLLAASLYRTARLRARYR